MLSDPAPFLSPFKVRRYYRTMAYHTSSYHKPSGWIGSINDKVCINTAHVLLISFLFLLLFCLQSVICVITKHKAQSESNFSKIGKTDSAHILEWMQ